MKKLLGLLTLTIALIVLFVASKFCQKPTVNSHYTIGIFQTASHPALDAVQEGFIEELRQKMGDDVGFIIKNAQGSIVTAHTIATSFANDCTYDAFFAIATPAVQALSALEKKRPLVSAAVTDPKALGIVYPETNVCGVTDMIDVAGEISMLQALVPTAKTVGILYTSGEVNSVMLAQKMKQELMSKDLIVFDCTMSTEADVQAVMEFACRKSDVVLAPTDNMVASTIALLSSLAYKYKKPFIVSDNMLVQAGPLAARGVDYKLIGKQAALMAYELLKNNKKPCELSFMQPESKEAVVNQKTVDLLGLSIPKSLSDVVTIVS